MMLRPKCVSRKIIKVFPTIVVVIFLFLGLLFWNIESINGAKLGLTFCSEILIPSTFPFMVLSAFIVKSGLSLKMSSAIAPLTKVLFGLPGCTGATILIGLVGGYPAGAKGIKALVDKGEISQAQAAKMLYFIVGAGPAFAISVVGSGLLRDYKIGLFLFISQIVSSILMGIILKFYKENHENLPTKPIKTDTNGNDISNSLIESCADSTSATLSMCSLVVLFYSTWEIIKNTTLESSAVDFFTAIGFSENISKSILPVLLEVTIGCRDCINFGVSHYLLAFALGWAGICVHFQIYTFMGGIKFSKIKFMIWRMLHGGLSVVIFSLILSIFPISVAVSQSNYEKVPVNAYSFTSGSLALILLCACFLSTLTPQTINSDKIKNNDLNTSA
ncbi:MAG: hypothetical protein LBI55_01310 [Oscillospiraceae bacterium]|nr:hypothetical protein [Oscillospiraceae bacterium]